MAELVRTEPVCVKALPAANLGMGAELSFTFGMVEISTVFSSFQLFNGLLKVHKSPHLNCE